MNVPDHFSGVASDYASFRPHYPDELFEWLASLCRRHELAWDCGCGSGQASSSLASHFDRVVGTDASLEQVAAARPDGKVRFVVASSQLVPLPGQSADIVTVAQALHWFALKTFYTEVRRVVRPGGIFSAWTYGMPHCVDEDVERTLHGFIDGPLGPYWPPEIQTVLDGYASIKLPFDEIEAPPFELDVEWSLDDFLGFARTWSAVRGFIDDYGEDPVLDLKVDLERLWGGSGDVLPIRYRLDLRVCRV